MAGVTVVLAVVVALGYFALATVVLPRIQIQGASPRFVKAFRAGGIAFFAGCGLTHTHIAVHAAQNGELVAAHETAFHFFQAVGVWVFVYVALRTIDVTVARRLTSGELLQARVDDLARSNADLERFAGIVSHDLQTPLRTVSGFAELLERREAERLDDRSRGYLDNLRAGCAQMGELLDGVLHYSRAAGGGFERRPVDLREVVDDVLAAAAGEIERTGAEIRVGDLPTVVGDRVALRQVVQNLIGNALKFSGERRPVVEVDAAAEDGSWVVTVRDEGVGVDPEDLEEIFEMLRRGRSGETEPGHGIGLAVCRTIVERHGGRMWAEPAVPQGTQFHFSLPAEVAAQAARPRVAEPVGA